jgi:hypothetical protein
VFRAAYGMTITSRKARLARFAYGAMASWMASVCPVRAQAPQGSPVTASGTPSSSDAADQPNPKATPSSSDVFATVIANQKRTEAAQDTYERIQRIEIRHSGGDANPSEVKVWRIFPFGTGTDKIPLTQEAKPINNESYRSDLEKLEKLLVWAAQTGPAQREAYAKFDRKRKERTDLLEATHSAFIFTKIGEEMRGDRKLVKYSMKPNPSYKPTTRNATVFTRVEGTVWVDESTNQLAKIEGHVTDDISLALFLAKVYKGSYFMQERYELFPGIWLPTFEQYDFDGRRFLLPFSIHERTFYEKYRRVGPPNEAVQVVRSELNKGESDGADP